MSTVYPARLEVDCQAQDNRATAAFRLMLAIPIVVVLGILTEGVTTRQDTDGGEVVRRRAAASRPGRSWPRR